VQNSVLLVGPAQVAVLMVDVLRAHCFVVGQAAQLVCTHHFGKVKMQAIVLCFVCCHACAMCPASICAAC
jgi:hypothetical protein